MSAPTVSIVTTVEVQNPISTVINVGPQGSPADIAVNGHPGPTIELAAADVGAFTTGQSDTRYLARAAYACDLSGTNTVLNTGGVASFVYGVAISVPPSPTRHVVLKAAVAMQITAAGAGGLFLGIYETTSGTGVSLQSTGVAGSFLAGTGSQFVQPPPCEVDIGFTTTERQFAIAGVLFRDSGSALAASIRSSSSFPFSWLKANLE